MSVQERGASAPLDLIEFVGNLPKAQLSPTMVLPPNIVPAIGNEDRKARIRKRIEEGGEFLTTANPKEGGIALCCYGPSLKDNIEAVRAYKGKICTVSGAHDLLKQHGIIPHYHVEMDPRGHKAVFVKNWSPKTKYYIATCCHDDMYDALEGANIVKWNVYSGGGDEKFLHELDPEQFCLEVGSVVGLGALIVMCVAGYRDFDIFGMDCSLENGKRHAGEHNGKPQRIMNVVCEGWRFQTTPQMIGAMNDFFNLVPRLGQVNINLHGEGLLQHRVRKFMEKQHAA